MGCSRVIARYGTDIDIAKNKGKTSEDQSDYLVNADGAEAGGKTGLRRRLAKIKVAIHDGLPIGRRPSCQWIPGVEFA